MTALVEISNLNGKWQGTNRLWMQPGEPVHESVSTMEIRTIAQGQFNEMSYTWEEGGTSQEGRIILGQTPGSRQVKAAWFDTWHLAHLFMTFEGQVDNKDAVRVKGSYAAPPGPDWGWQITFEPGQGSWHLVMHNITPAGEAFLAVETVYQPK